VFVHDFIIDLCNEAKTVDVFADTQCAANTHVTLTVAAISLQVGDLLAQHFLLDTHCGAGLLIHIGHSQQLLLKFLFAVCLDLRLGLQKNARIKQHCPPDQKNEFHQATQTHDCDEDNIGLDSLFLQVDARIHNVVNRNNNVDEGQDHVVGQ